MKENFVNDQRPVSRPKTAFITVFLFFTKRKTSRPTRAWVVSVEIVSVVSVEIGEKQSQMLSVKGALNKLKISEIFLCVEMPKS